MMKRRTVLAMGLAVTMAASVFTGCNSSENTEKTSLDKPVSSLENTAQTDSGKNKEDLKEKEDTGKTTAVLANVSKEGKDQSAAADPAQTKTEVKQESGDTANAENAQSGNTSNTSAAGPEPSGDASAQARTEVKPENGNTANDENAQTANSSNTSAASTKPTDKNTSGSNLKNSSAAVTTQPSAPAHEHSWQEHTAATKQWIPNIVTVDDYETKTIYGAQFYRVISDTEMIGDGPIYWFENGFTYDDLEAISYNALVNGDQGVIDGICYSQYVNVQKTKDIKVGSHEEDHGHYETSTKVDYYYCNCGATK